jgi:hypothetical protein
LILKGKTVGNNCGLLQTDSLRTEVALKIVYNNNFVTPAVDVFINERKVEAVFDSGSYGLRVLSGILKKERSDSTGAPDIRNPFGARFFFDFDVLYDQVNGVIGVRKKQ